MKLTRQDIKGIALDFLDILRARTINGLEDLKGKDQLRLDDYTDGYIITDRKTGEPAMKYMNAKMPSGLVPLTAVPSTRAYSRVAVLCSEEIPSYKKGLYPDNYGNFNYSKILAPSNFELIIEELARLSKLE